MGTVSLTPELTAQGQAVLQTTLRLRTIREAGQGEYCSFLTVSALGWLRQEDCKIKDSLDYGTKPCLKSGKMMVTCVAHVTVMWHTPLVLLLRRQKQRISEIKPACST